MFNSGPRGFVGRAEIRNSFSNCSHERGCPLHMSLQITFRSLSNDVLNPTCLKAP